MRLRELADDGPPSIAMYGARILSDLAYEAKKAAEMERYRGSRRNNAADVNASRARGRAAGRRTLTANKRWTEERVLESIRSWTTEHGRQPNTQDWKFSTETHPAYATICTLFGSWAAGMEAARGA